MKKIISLTLIVLMICSLSIQSVYATDVKFSRGSFCMKIVEVLNLQADISDTKTFYDVKSDDNYYESIMIMCKLGYINPYEDGTFKPEKVITRAEAKNAFFELREQAADVPEMSLDEINAEISAVRAERKR